MWGRSKLLLVALLVVGCAPKVRFEGVDSVRRYGTVGMDVAVRVANDSRRTIRVEAAEFTFSVSERYLGEARLRDTIVVPGRWEGVLTSRWRFDAPDVASEYALQRRLEERRWEGLKIECVGVVRVGKTRRAFSLPQSVISEFLSTFAPCEE